MNVKVNEVLHGVRISTSLTKMSRLKSETWPSVQDIHRGSPANTGMA